MDTVKSEIKSFIVENFLFGQAGAAIADDQSLLESGVVDSTGLLELVTFLEQQYGIAVEDRELIPANLDSLANLTQFVARKQTVVTA